MKMTPRVKVLKQLVEDGQFVIDDVAVAEAMLLRSMALRMLPDVSFRGVPARVTRVRSFRPDRGARSFRLSRSERRPQHVRDAGIEPIA